jgi:DNA-binding transcriptional LysR family regulator
VKKFGSVRYTSRYFTQMDYVDYKAGEPIVRNWFRHHLHRHSIHIRTRAHVFDVQGVAKFIITGLGLGVLPDYVVEKLVREGVDLHVYDGKLTPLKNEICLTYLPLKDRPLAQTVIMDRLREIHGK